MLIKPEKMIHECRYCGEEFTAEKKDASYCRNSSPSPVVDVVDLTPEQIKAELSPLMIEPVIRAGIETILQVVIEVLLRDDSGEEKYGCLDYLSGWAVYNEN